MAGPQPAATDSTSSTPSREVMGSGDVSRALRRMAHEILERNKGAGDLVLLGIPSRGVPLAHRLAAVMAEVEDAHVPVGSLDVTMHRDDLRHQPVRPLARTSVPAGGIDDKVVVLVDDVLFHGRTIRAALEALAELGRPRAVRLAVLVDRGHRELPIRADHVGKNLPTAASERVRVRLAEVDGTDGGDAVTIGGGGAA
jgi:pyrimidine operon attenuation protein/uracil phosphoribosyltransferase